MMSDSAVDTVLIRNEAGAEFEIKGDPNTNFGQHIVVDFRDGPQQTGRRLQDSEATEAEEPAPAPEVEEEPEP